MDNKKLQFSVIGYGRFGKLWAEILSKHGDVFVFDKNKNIQKGKFHFTDLNKALKKDVIFLCIPISQMESFLKENNSKISKSSTIIDTASVKEMPLKWMDKHIPNIPHLGLHPLFGPDSYAKNRINLIIISASKQFPSLIKKWQKTLVSWHFFTRIVSASDHDKSIAFSQGMTHFIGNIVKKMNITKTETPTLGYSMLMSVEQFCENNTHQLFRDMISFNRYSGEMLKSFLQASHNVSSYFKKKNVDYNSPFSIGVMGAKGSFSHEAANNWLNNNHIKKGKIKYLITAKKVFDELNFGKIQLGIFPIQNAIGGIVDETISGLSKYRCKIKEHFPFVVNQCLIKRKDSKNKQPREIHSHPQALKQCKGYLKKHFSNIPLIEENDTATAARNLAKNKLGKGVFVIAPEASAKLYDLKLVEKNIQDLGYNITDFVIVIKD